MPPRTLVVGLPRSGTSWLGAVLARAPDTHLVFEPENSDLDIWTPAALGSSRGYEPVLRSTDLAPLYELLWEYAFLGGRASAEAPARGSQLARFSRRLKPAARRLAAAAPLVGPAIWRSRARLRRRHPERRHVIVKSVVASMSVEWIVGRFQPQVAVIHRDALDMIASWVEMGFPPRPTPSDPLVAARVLTDPRVPRLRSGASLVERVAWGIGVRRTFLQDAVARHTEWTVVNHEDLVDDPVHLFPLLFDRLGLQWTPAVEQHLLRSDAAGSGYQLRRKWSELRKSRSQRLTPADAAAAKAVLSEFPGDLLSPARSNLAAQAK